MRIETLYDFIEDIVGWEDSNELSHRHKSDIRAVLYAHEVRNYNARSLYSIAPDLEPRDLKKLIRILIQKKIEVPCGICGDIIKRESHLNIDHIYPLNQIRREFSAGYKGGGVSHREFAARPQHLQHREGRAHRFNQPL
ncbi:MAG: hypothetical protein LBL46_03825 [Rickettsiales bacterium]|jgi:hypothetical protein|nr:hypothetical protein [Rickettsiales bacterium]